MIVFRDRKSHPQRSQLGYPEQSVAGRDLLAGAHIASSYHSAERCFNTSLAEFHLRNPQIGLGIFQIAFCFLDFVLRTFELISCMVDLSCVLIPAFAISWARLRSTSATLVSACPVFQIGFTASDLGFGSIPLWQSVQCHQAELTLCLFEQPRQHRLRSS